jgi:hypothetical protein
MRPAMNCRIGLYFRMEIWWGHMFLPRDAVRHLHFTDSALCGSVAAGGIAALTFRCGWKALAGGVAIPFMVWNWLIGCAGFGFPEARG